MIERRLRHVLFPAEHRNRHAPLNLALNNPAPPNSRCTRLSAHARQYRQPGRRAEDGVHSADTYVERSFAHVCETGGARRTWLHGLIKTAKRYLITAAGKNLGVIMRALFNIGKPKTLQTGGEGGFSLIWVEITAVWRDYRAFAGDLTNEIVSGVIRPTYSLARYAQRNLPAAA